eukprot:m.55685 g.55685  ORF g.55685 m.55685 type:complete len:55 (-) comp48898_c0_seq3:50-214(-)
MCLLLGAEGADRQEGLCALAEATSALSVQCESPSQLTQVLTLLLAPGTHSFASG